MSRDVWCPFAEQDILRSGAGPFVNAPAKIAHHTTEGGSYAGARAAYKASGSLPHFTDSFEHGRYEVWQHLPVDQAATALAHPKGKPETNRAKVIQIEHVGRAAKAAAFPGGYLQGIGILCRWIETTVGVPRSAPFKFGEGAPRLSWEQWETFAGHFGHCHVPGNDHWDPGALDIDTILNVGLPAVAPEQVPVPVPAVVSHATAGGQPVKVVIVTIPTDANGDGDAPAPDGFLSVSDAGSHDKYDPATTDTDSLVVPVGARRSVNGWRLVVAGGPKSTTVGAPVLVAD